MGSVLGNQDKGGHLQGTCVYGASLVEDILRKSFVLYLPKILMWKNLLTYIYMNINVVWDIKWSFIILFYYFFYKYILCLYFICVILLYWYKIILIYGSSLSVCHLQRTPFFHKTWLLCFRNVAFYSEEYSNPKF